METPKRLFRPGGFVASESLAIQQHGYLGKQNWSITGAAYAINLLGKSYCFR
ncbi:hypothetical protein KQI82_14105 [Oscillibacter sp. MSJ-2]|uniref:Uncharacterized protein n=1 Tax=Dysosmobacter acutus TaxID=2841504 RepID=A0ABS6FEQ8_9FIRM|nr:hypothetical protein [Dysosmobacter acutus]MBU5628042.1 hypothetical protein [Dysosmobacter acutus]